MTWYKFTIEWVEYSDGYAEKRVEVYSPEGEYITFGVTETYDPSWGYSETISSELKKYGYYNRMGVAQ